MVIFPVIPSQLALVNVDIQNCFVETSAPDSLQVLDRINHLAQVCREKGIPVFHIRHALSVGLVPGVLGEFFPIVKKGLLDRDSETAAFHKNLVRDPRDIILEKPHFWCILRNKSRTASSPTGY